MNEILFFNSELELNSSEIHLSKEESFHISHVLRHQQGEMVFVTNGQGIKAKAVIKSILKHEVVLSIQTTEITNFTQTSIHAAFCPMKSRENIEWTVEKLTELGISEISLIISQRTERNSINFERLQKIAISALKQSFRFYLPKINPSQNFKNFVENHSKFNVQKLIAWCGATTENTILKQYKKNNEVVFLIGPEGDFTENEVEFAVGNGFAPLSLGSSRLRSETAALYAASAIISLNQ